ncbi:serine hydrolase domain-containing protein [Fundidesulfovibrio terrae]|uniref:serine hydrolase domain-containing protein n=1 Tax=Fundidesulfovibrio terrae TaxID=2922866 RepID=UPI001FAFB39A|nr:serine hydrolase domain-containing protein [Fundidesulfovibrio terrae]
MKTARIVSSLLISALVLAACPAWAQRGNPRMEYGGQSVDAMAASFMAENGVPGMALAIVQAPYIPRVTGYGLADIGKKLLVGSNTAFDLGRMGEAFTAVAVMQLVETDRLGLDDPVGRHLDNLPESWRPVTIRMLLSHASGIPDYARDACADPARPLDLAAVVSAVGGKPLAFAPGSAVSGSATDYFLLALAVEAAGKERFEDFVRVNQFERLGLRQTFFAGETEKGRGEAVEQNGNRHKEFLSNPGLINPVERAAGYRATFRGLAQATPPHPRARLGSGGIWASAMDVSLWDVGLAGGILVKDPAMRALLYSPAVLAGGRREPVMGAWRFPGRAGLMYVTGDADGQSTYLSRFTDPSELVCVTLLANKEGVDLSQLARRIAGAYDPRLGPPLMLGMRMQQSPYPVKQTLARFQAAMREFGAKEAGEASTSKASAKPGAEKAGMEKPGQEAKASGPGHQVAERMVFDFPAAPGRTVRITARAWEQDGQVWLGCTDPAGAGGASATPGGYGASVPVDPASTSAVIRAKLDRALVAAVTPY